MQSDLTNMFVALDAGRTVATPVNDQFATPALGWGFNAALFDAGGHWRWEAGTDLRANEGESRENYFNSGGVFQNTRRAGGRLLVAGAYGELAHEEGPLLLTGELRGDVWKTSQGHLVQTERATGDVLSADYPEGRSGFLPTGHAGARYALGGGQALRAAAYTGFRPPSLNELYRPFRVGNDITNANSALQPERLSGGELGWDLDAGSLAAHATLFWNRLDKAIANVTIGMSTAGGALRERRNAGAIEAVGLEADLDFALTERLGLNAAIAVTDARFAETAEAIALRGKRPAQAPRASVTGGTTWRLSDALTLSATMRWESTRFDDDLNSRRLPSTFTLDLGAQWRLPGPCAVTLAWRNATDTRVATALDEDGVAEYGAPRAASIGMTCRG
jgi:outer membrane receptor protein involved in Fe transport